MLQTANVTFVRVGGHDYRRSKFHERGFVRAKRQRKLFSLSRHTTLITCASSNVLFGFGDAEQFVNGFIHST